MDYASPLIVDPKLSLQQLSLFYGEKQALQEVSLRIAPHTVTALIGPSGCGKSSLLRCINRMNDLIENCHITGKILLDQEDIYAPHVDVVALRTRVGMVFQKPNPFPKSIYDNIAYGLRLHGFTSSKDEEQERVKLSLQRSGLWEEVKDRLDVLGTSLSGGQQQRLCIARTIAIGPEVILTDEPCSALDPIATAKIEELIDSLSEHFTIVIVTHSMQQAARISEYTAFLHMGTMVEYGATEQIFTQPKIKKTEDYITGRFG